ncbi:MAG: energy-coupling factor ABC transporter permease [Thiohalobacteraceae bacterium]
MDFPAHIVPELLRWLTTALAALWLVIAARRMPRERLTESGFIHVLFGASIGVLLLWSLRAGVPPVFNFHLLGVTVLTLMLGWHFASLAVALALLGITLNGQAEWASFGINFLVMGAIPIALTWRLLQLVQRRLPHNFFIYVYINGFLAAGLSILAATGVGVGLLWLTGARTNAWLEYQYLPFFPLMVFAEALLNGMVMTLLVALRPAWVCSFDDELYINGK